MADEGAAEFRVADAARGRRRWFVVGSLGAIASGVVWMLGGRPFARMTVSRVNREIGRGVHPGQSLAEVEAWVLSRGITAGIRVVLPGYSVFFRPVDGAPGPPWMGVFGDQNRAQRAGIAMDSVHAMLQVTHPEASRGILSVEEITISFFFDSNLHLIRHSVDSVSIGL